MRRRALMMAHVAIYPARRPRVSVASVAGYTGNQPNGIIPEDALTIPAIWTFVSGAIWTAVTMEIFTPLGSNRAFVGLCIAKLIGVVGGNPSPITQSNWGLAGVSLGACRDEKYSK